MDINTVVVVVAHLKHHDRYCWVASESQFIASEQLEAEAFELRTTLLHTFEEQEEVFLVRQKLWGDRYFLVCLYEKASVVVPAAWSIIKQQFETENDS